MENKQTKNWQAQEYILTSYKRIRHDSEALCEPLETEDFGIQTMPEVSPPKWHLAHTSWFFETLLLKPFYDGYEEYNPKFAILFNSYYDTLGSYHPRHQRGLLSRPTVAEIYRYRTHIDNAMVRLLSDTKHPRLQEIVSRTVLGLNHEQQHQELLLTDIKHIFALNPLRPTYKHQNAKQKPFSVGKEQSKIDWIDFTSGIKSLGFSGDGFSYDNEEPQHKVYLESFQLASRPVTNGEYLEFIIAGGYQQATLWLSDAWKIVNQQQWQAPLYWERINNEWCHMTLSGMQPIDENSPVCHVSFYEAAAYARWSGLEHQGVRLPTEAEWEIAATGLNINGNLRESEILQPHSAQQRLREPLQQMFGDVWEWTSSAYAAYPGYHAASGPLGEYNGKFMSSQMVLRGGSCVTATDHVRATYRNFFYPHERWQFSGFRLAKDI